MKQIFPFILVLLFACSAVAQVNRDAFDQQRQQIREQYARQKNQMRQQYDDARKKAEAEYAAFRKKANEEYAAAVKKAWQQMGVQPAVPKPKEPEPPQPPAPEPDKEPSTEPLPQGEVKPLPVPLRLCLHRQYPNLNPKFRPCGLSFTVPIVRRMPMWSSWASN